MNSKNRITTKNLNEPMDRHIYCDSKDDILFYASQYYLFHDYGLDQTEITDILIEGEHIEYAGWYPNNIVKFRKADTKEILWTKRF